MLGISFMLNTKPRPAPGGSLQSQPRPLISGAACGQDQPLNPRCIGSRESRLPQSVPTQSLSAPQAQSIRETGELTTTTIPRQHLAQLLPTSKLSGLHGGNRQSQNPCCF